MTEYHAFVAENLGGKLKNGWYELEEMEDSEFSPLNVVILKKYADVQNWRLALTMRNFHNESQIKD